MSRRSLEIPALVVNQPIGEFYLGVIEANDLVEISSADMRRIESDLDQYVGIQRKLSQERVKEIGSFVNSIDATFPASVVLAVPGECAKYNAKTQRLELFEQDNEDLGEVISYAEIASILDGQHRVEGLKAFRDGKFQVPVSIFVNADIADQAYVFATVNLAQTKVNKSLVYDLLDYAAARSPQKTCHDVAVALDRAKSSPLFEMIKRLGTATEGRSGETLAQATVVESLLPFISKKPEEDRYRLAKGKKVRIEDFSYEQCPFRGLWVMERDADISRILIEYFSAVRDRWGDAWSSRDRGEMLARTNGFRALMRFLKMAYLKIKPDLDLENPIIRSAKYSQLFDRVKLGDSDFSIDRYPPGTSGETKLFGDLREGAGI